jgi:hypothetical protein
VDDVQFGECEGGEGDGLFGVWAGQSKVFWCRRVDKWVGDVVEGRRQTLAVCRVDLRSG